MKKNYDFSSAVRNPYAKRLKRQLAISLKQPSLKVSSRRRPGS